MAHSRRSREFNRAKYPDTVDAVLGLSKHRSGNVQEHRAAGEKIDTYQDFYSLHTLLTEVSGNIVKEAKIQYGA